MLLEDGLRVLIDVTRDFTDQARDIGGIDAVLLTHGHRDASGGLASLRRWWRGEGGDPLPVYASAATIAAAKRRFALLDHCRFVPVREGELHRLGPWRVSALEVPHAREERYPTFAWRLSGAGKKIVYASDLARLTPELDRFSDGAAVLVIDGAMWKRQIFSHLTIDAELPELCRWRVDRILLTQLGKTLPPHERLELEARARCERARPAYDGLVLRI